MKFGQNLPRMQIPEWAGSYINYKGLKKLIKVAAIASEDGEHADLAEFYFSLDRNLEDVDAFYNKKYAEYSRRLKLLSDRYPRSSDVDHEEARELHDALRRLRGQLRNLKTFGEVNRDGFIKITKKLDKKVPNTSFRQGYISAKVDPKPFANNTQLLDAMKQIKDWMSSLGDLSVEDTKSINSLSATTRTAAASFLPLLNAEQVSALDKAVKHDDVLSMKNIIKQADFDLEEGAMQGAQLKLLQLAITHHSAACTEALLKDIDTLDEVDDIHSRNCLHRIVITIGKSKSFQGEDHQGGMIPITDPDEDRFITPATHPFAIPQPSKLPEAPLMSINDAPVKFFNILLGQLQPRHRRVLLSRDSYGRIPLHYGAEYGIVVICQLLMYSMQQWGMFDVAKGIDAPEWQDSEGNAPLHLSVINGHPLTTKALLSGENWLGKSDDKAVMRRDIAKSSEVLIMAVRADFTDIVQSLVEAGVDINWQDPAGESALHIAAHLGRVKCAEMLLKGTECQKADIELAEKSFAWTPLHEAAVRGQLDMVKLLVAAGADVQRPDASTWTAKEHAALRGHMKIARFLAEQMSIPQSRSEANHEAVVDSALPLMESLEDRRPRNGGQNARIIPPIKSFGHRYLKNESKILVSLGSMSSTKDIKPIDLDRIPMAKAHATELDTALSLVVSAIGADGEPTIIDLPVNDNISTDPIEFTTPDASKVQILFDIIPTYAASRMQKIGRGVALLHSIRPTIGTDRMNLQGDVSVPILGRDLDVLGTVNFNFLVITPFEHPNMEITERATYWKSVSSTMLIGHRGLGKNRESSKSLQLGENTIQSFIAAANLGAQYVEFDVQLTKDHEPVIYHDFLVSETGIDAPVHTLTLAQFQHLNKDSSQNSRAPSPHSKNPLNKILRGEDRQRSFSVGHGVPHTMDEKMQHTRDFKEKGYKANSRGLFIQAPFATLKDIFLQTPETTGFNIEMKYPMLFESESFAMDTYAIDINCFVDTILKTVYDLANKRDIIFSSFNPDVCLLLSFKQPSIPILFLTDAGTDPAGDIRACSLKEAIRFASRWNLLGVVSAAEPFCNSPRLIKAVKERGLVCVSYGTLNNDPEMVQYQREQGIDAVISDDVLKIRKELSKDYKTKETNGAVQGSAPTNGGQGNGLIPSGAGVAITAPA